MVPQLTPIIYALDDMVRRNYADESVAIIDKNDLVHMAHIDIHYGFSINGVARLHTEILENNELNNFYKILSGEIQTTRTNGITFRRWLLHCDHELTKFITSLIGEGYKTDATELEKLLKFKDDKKVLSELLKIKQFNKTVLKDYILPPKALKSMITPSTISRSNVCMSTNAST